MRITIRTEYRNYPQSEELTKKSVRVGSLTHPMTGLVIGGMLVYLTMMLLPTAYTLMAVLFFGASIGGAIFLPKYRKKKFAQFALLILAQ